jgi:large subunit ribosomal protein L29
MNVMAKDKEIEEIRELSDEDLAKALEEAHRDLFNLRFRAATRQLERHQAVGIARKRIARIKTVQTQRLLGIG